ncbi:unnamed protein product [Pleuronectes platessa]|uniref:Uncharacterized protein n=1 Tax=Pleuronectes platessa TaxID=8262 RepID=A0A9N7UEE3_PLEPL|nr:unnamed protein product [Pleuronectes platessa]
MRYEKASLRIGPMRIERRMKAHEDTMDRHSSGCSLKLDLDGSSTEANSSLESRGKSDDSSEGLVHVPSNNMQEAGFMTYPLASQQGATKTPSMVSTCQT